jgi:hypothetical protein
MTSTPTPTPRPPPPTSTAILYEILIWSSASVVGNVTCNTDSLSVRVTSTRAYVGNYNGRSLQAIDITNPTTPTVLGTLAFGGTNGPRYIDILGDQYALAIFAGGAYMGLLKIIDISNPASMTIIGSVSDGNGASFLDNQVVADVNGTYAYIVNPGNQTLKIADISTKSSPVMVGSGITCDAQWAVAVNGNYAYVTTTSGVQIVDCTVKTALVNKGTYNCGSQPLWITVLGNYVYTSCNGGQFNIANVTDPNNPVVVTIQPSASVLTGHVINQNGRYAYLCYSLANTVRVVDISNPAAPVSVGTLALTASTYSCIDSFPGSVYCYVTDRANGVLRAIQNVFTASH